MRRILVVFVLLVALVPCVSRVEAATDVSTPSAASAKAPDAPTAPAPGETFSRWLMQTETATTADPDAFLIGTTSGVLCVRATCRFCPSVGPCCLSSCACC